MSVLDDALSVPTVRLMAWAKEHADPSEMERLRKRQLERMEHRRQFPVPGKILKFDINDPAACEAVAIEVAARQLYLYWLAEGGTP